MARVGARLEVDRIAEVDRNRHLAFGTRAAPQRDEPADRDRDRAEDRLGLDRLAEDDRADDERPDEAEVSERGEIAGPTPAVGAAPAADGRSVPRDRRCRSRPIATARARVLGVDREEDRRRDHAHEAGVEQGHIRRLVVERPGQQAEQRRRRSRSPAGQASPARVCDGSIPTRITTPAKPRTRRRDRSADPFAEQRARPAR